MQARLLWRSQTSITITMVCNGYRYQKFNYHFRRREAIIGNL